MKKAEKSISVGKVFAGEASQSVFLNANCRHIWNMLCVCNEDKWGASTTTLQIISSDPQAV